MSSFQQVYETYAKPLYRFLLTLTRKEETAEELLSETFYQAFLHIDRFEGRCSVYTWLCQIGKNAWLTECRRNKRYPQISYDDLQLPAEGLSLEDQLIRKELCAKAWAALQKLEPPCRDVFIMHAIGEIKLKEIAAVYGKSESWARVTYFRAKQKIAEEALK